jgi:hypothetical protein
VDAAPESLQDESIAESKILVAVEQYLGNLRRPGLFQRESVAAAPLERPCALRSGAAHLKTQTSPALPK